MKTQTVIGEEMAKEKVAIHEYEGGSFVVESGDPFMKTFIKNRKLVKTIKGTVTEVELSNVSIAPQKWTFKKGILAKKSKKK